MYALVSFQAVIGLFVDNLAKMVEDAADMFGLNTKVCHSLFFPFRQRK